MNWKTTLVGIFLAFTSIAGPSVQARLSGDHSAPPITTNNMLTAAGLAALGYLAKDKDVTGGTREQ